MMEKYGAEVQKYEVLEVTPYQPDDKKVVASGLSMDEAIDMADKNKNYMIMPMN